ncbi:hypothetical protein KR009_005073, partial [Drosophila setifemur]
MNPSSLEKDVADKVRFHLSKEELERQMRDIHNRGDSGEGKSQGQSGSGRSQSMNSLTDLPRQDSWIFESVGGFYLPTEDLAKIPLQRQEELLVRDLIYAFSGVPSSHIKTDIQIDEIAEMSAVDIAKVRFRLDDAFSGAFKALANELLPLIGYYISVQSFIEETNMTPSCGRTRLALATAFGDTMQQYYDLQSKLESDLQEKKLNLKDLVRQVRPWLAILKIFSGMACTSRSDINSAQLLSLLDDFVKEQKTTDVELKDRTTKVLGEVTRTYMKIVQLWMQKGVLYDNQHEFFVEDNDPSNTLSSTLLSPDQCSHEYWAQRYSILPDRLPDFLLHLGQEIFLGGKYLNILRQCNVPLKVVQQPLSYNPEDSKHVGIIRSCYELTAKKLLEVLLKEHHLMPHLRNLRGYFLLQHDGFSEALLDKWQVQLQSNVDRLIPEKVQTLLTEVLQKSNDPFKDMVRCQLKECDVATQLAEMQSMEESEEKEEEEIPEALNLCGYESLALRYKAKWPLSFVLHSELLEHLQILQRVMLFLRYVQLHLSALWKTPAEGLGLMQTSRSGSLRYRMHMSMLNLEHHITLDIAESRWQSLLATVEKAQTIDDVLKQFRLTLDECLRLGLLSSATTFVRSLFTLGQVCLNFCEFVKSLPGGSSCEDFEKGVEEYEEEFDSFLGSILELVRELAKSNSAGEKDDEREACKQILKRLEE